MAGYLSHTMWEQAANRVFPPKLPWLRTAEAQRRATAAAVEYMFNVELRDTEQLLAWWYNVGRHSDDLPRGQA